MHLKVDPDSMQLEHKDMLVLTTDTAGCNWSNSFQPDELRQDRVRATGATEMQQMHYLTITLQAGGDDLEAD